MSFNSLVRENMQNVAQQLQSTSTRNAILPKKKNSKHMLQ